MSSPKLWGLSAVRDIPVVLPLQIVFDRRPAIDVLVETNHSLSHRKILEPHEAGHRVRWERGEPGPGGTDAADTRPSTEKVLDKYRYVWYGASRPWSDIIRFLSSCGSSE
jgi:hypothetical protein